MSNTFDFSGSDEEEMPPLTTIWADALLEEPVTEKGKTLRKSLMGEDASFFEKLLGPDDMARKLGVVLKEVALLQTAYIAQVSNRLSLANRQFSLYQAQAGKTMEWAVEVASEWKGDLQARKISEGKALRTILKAKDQAVAAAKEDIFGRV